MLTPDFLFDQVASIRNYEGYGREGDKLGEPYELPCRVEMSRKRVSRQSIQGAAVEEVIANARAFFPAGTRFEPNTRITVDGRSYAVLSVTPQRAFRNENHVEVMLL